MNKTPQVHGLILCEAARVETSPPRFCLDGLILAREFDSFPTPALAFVVYAALYGGSGEGVIRLACMELASEEEIYYHERWIGFSKPPGTIHYIVPIKQIGFEHPGRYCLTLSFDNEVITTRYLNIRSTKK